MSDQGEVIAFLSKGLAFGLPDQLVERIDTHAAIVFLIGDRAYKLKRAVRYSFLDFSTVEKRHRVLESEYRLNVRTAPDLYRRLIPVTCDVGGCLALEGKGEIVDWLLEMSRFDQAVLLDHLAEQGRLDAPLIEALASEIADLHQKAPVRRGGGYEAMASIVEGNAGDLASLTDDIGKSETIALLIDATRSELSRQRERVDRRVDAGFVRHCHGDLHLGNIYLDGVRPVLFDCLEFDEALATIDVIYDLAFLLMDLRHRKLDSLAVDLLNAYLDRTEDDDGMALMPLFLTVRATIRAKIEGFEIKTAGSEEEREKHRLAAIQYLDLARDLLSVESPALIAIGGLSGTGKSTVARLLAHRLGQRRWPLVLRSDVIRKHLSGVEPTTQLSPEAYSWSHSADVYRHLRKRTETLLRAGRAVIVDATFLDPAERTRIEALADDLDVPFQGIWLDAPRNILESRIQERHGDASDADVDVLSKQLERDLGDMTWTLVDAGKGADQVAIDIHVGIFDPKFGG
ncbi:MAG: AAA family ATPase [Alphaproteobacteria bacterium]|nr:AAA family ATPase [Alphaproteobacteria bacterium]